jgi:proton-dependent oligopeptide transporter, POT family
MSDYFSKMALGTEHLTDPLLTNAGFSHTFALLGWISIGGGVALLLVTPFMKRLMQERRSGTYSREESVAVAA